MVIPNNTNTIAMLIVDVIFAFKNRAVDTFFFFDIQNADEACSCVFNLLKTQILPKSGAK